MTSPDRSRPGSFESLPDRQPGAIGAATRDPADAYAGVPILNKPLWSNEIAAYFYLGGISSGAFIIGTLAELSGEKWRSLAQTAHVVSFAAMTPCAPLLIHDLGRPSRFHHMFRIFKPSSPMNLGAWTLLVHSGCCTLLAARALANQGMLPLLGTLARRLPARALGAAGIVPAMTLGGYSGVLLGTTSVPVWSRSPMLGGLFMSSAIATGAAAVSLASRLSGGVSPAEHSVLATVGLAAGATEFCLGVGFLATSGELSKPLLEGIPGALMLGAGTASVTSIALDLMGKRPQAKQRRFGLLTAAAALAASAMLRWAVVRAGAVSATERDANLVAMSPSARNPGWGPPGVESRTP